MATATETINKFFDDIPEPRNLSQEHIKLCRSYAMNKLTERKPIADWCKDNGISTKSFYRWKDEQPNFEKYYLQLIDAGGNDGIEEAFQKIDKKMVQLAEKENMSVQELKLFQDWFAGHMEVRKKKVMMMGGLDENNKVIPSPEERRNSLLNRLKPKTKENE